MTKHEFNTVGISNILNPAMKELVRRLYIIDPANIKLIQRAVGEKTDGWLGKDTYTAINNITVKQIDVPPPKGKKLDKTSLKRLKGVHPDIVKVVELAYSLCSVDFMVVDGLRTQKLQNRLVRMGRSHSLRSYHLYGLAVDLAPIRNGKILWNNMKGYKAIRKAIGQAQSQLGINVLANAMFDLHWKSLVDYPHYQMRTDYVSNRNPREYYSKHKYKGFS